MFSEEKTHEITFVDKNGIIIEIQKVNHGEYINPKTLFNHYNGNYTLTAGILYYYWYKHID